MTLTVTVTQKHINEGFPRAVQACPVALALNEALQSHCQEVNSRVPGHYAQIQVLDDEFFNVDLPVDVVDWIKAFDNAGDRFEQPDPMSFDLVIEDGLI